MRLIRVDHLQLCPKREKSAKETMIPTEVNETLHLFGEQRGGHWLGRNFILSIAKGENPARIDVNCSGEKSLAFCRGVLTAKGYDCTPRGSDNKKYICRGSGKYGLFKLRTREEVRVVDFDYIHYHARSGSFYLGEEIELHMKGYREKKCQLVFDPRNRSEEHFSREQQKVLGRYIKEGWTIQDTEGKEVTFTDGRNQKKLDHSLLWTIIPVAADVLKTTIPEIVESPLTYEDFLKEFHELLVKYGMTQPNNK